MRSCRDRGTGNRACVSLMVPGEVGSPATLGYLFVAGFSFALRRNMVPPARVVSAAPIEPPGGRELRTMQRLSIGGVPLAAPQDGRAV